jgi:hypothetical protein
MAKLDRIINLLALDTVKGLEPEDQISRLSDMKFQPIEIAPIVGKTSNAVRVALHHIRKKKPKTDETPDILEHSEDQAREG